MRRAIVRPPRETEPIDPGPGVAPTRSGPAIPGRERVQNALAHTYLVLALGGGLVMAVLNPPFQAPDEPNHFFRAIAISHGYWLATRDGPYVGAPMPAGMIAWVFALSDDIAGHPERKQSAAFVKAHLDVRGEGGATAFADFRNTALYSPVGYLPQAAALAIGRWTGLPLLGALYLARLANLVVGACICYWACRQLPYGQLTLVLVLVSPVFLFETASLSADASSYALTIAFTALVLRTAHERSGAAPGRRSIAALCGLGALTCLTKPSAAPVPLLALLLLDRRRAPAGRAWREAGVVIGVSWIALLAWTVVVSGLYVPAHPLVAVDPRAQLGRILADPVGFAGVVRHTIALDWLFYYRSAIGILGWLDTPLATPYTDGLLVALAVSGAVPGPGLSRPAWRERLLALGVVGATYVLLAVIMDLTWTAVGADVIEGVQGRYFLPLAALTPALVQWPASAQARLSPGMRLVAATGCLAYAVLLLGHAFQTMAARFWHI